MWIWSDDGLEIILFDIHLHIFLPSSFIFVNTTCYFSIFTSIIGFDSLFQYFVNRKLKKHSIEFSFSIENTAYWTNPTIGLFLCFQLRCKSVRKIFLTYNSWGNFQIGSCKLIDDIHHRFQTERSEPNKRFSCIYSHRVIYRSKKAKRILSYYSITNFGF